jgi:V/A-type H+-transporting ATPase subunit E
MAEALLSHGVEDLITRLKTDGVKAGEAEAERILAEARKKAETIITQAEQQAKDKLAHARKEIDQEKKAAGDAIQLAYRDTVLAFHERLQRRFAGDVKQLVNQAMPDAALLRQLIVAVVLRQAQGLPEGSALEGVLPEGVLDIEAIRSKTETLSTDPLMPLVRQVAAQVVQGGLVLFETADTKDSIKISADNGGLTLIITPEAVSAALLTYLHPRFKAILEGVAP